MLLDEPLELVFMVKLELLADELDLRQFDLFVLQLFFELLILLKLYGEYQKDKRVYVLIGKLLSVPLDLGAGIHLYLLIQLIDGALVEQELA